MTTVQSNLAKSKAETTRIGVARLQASPGIIISTPVMAAQSLDVSRKASSTSARLLVSAVSEAKQSEKQQQAVIDKKDGEDAFVESLATGSYFEAQLQEQDQNQKQPITPQTPTAAPDESGADDGGEDMQVIAQLAAAMADDTNTPIVATMSAPKVEAVTDSKGGLTSAIEWVKADKPRAVAIGIIIAAIAYIIYKKVKG